MEAGKYDVYGGAGFFAPQQQTAGSPSRTFQQQRAVGNRRRDTTIRPVTVKQILNAQNTADDSVFMIDEEDILEVTMVGKVMSTKRQSQQFVIEFTDHTGKVVLNYWLTQEELPIFQELRAGMYVRAFGRVIVFNEERKIELHEIRVVEDSNEVTFHLLDVLYSHLAMIASHREGPTEISGMGTGTLPITVGAAGDFAMEENGMPPLQARVVEIVKVCENKQIGMHFDELVKQLSSEASYEQVREAVNALAGEGYLYSTTDDSHYMALD